MVDPDTYIFVTCSACGALILKPHTTPASTFTAYSYRPAIGLSKTPRRAASDTSATCSQCRGKTALSAKNLPK